MKSIVVCAYSTSIVYAMQAGRWSDLSTVLEQVPRIVELSVYSALLIEQEMSGSELRKVA